MTKLAKLAPLVAGTAGQQKISGGARPLCVPVYRPTRAARSRPRQHRRFDLGLARLLFQRDTQVVVGRRAPMGGTMLLGPLGGLALLLWDSTCSRRGSRSLRIEAAPPCSQMLCATGLLLCRA